MVTLLIKNQHLNWTMRIIRFGRHRAQRVTYASGTLFPSGNLLVISFIQKVRKNWQNRAIRRTRTKYPVCPRSSSIRFWLIEDTFWSSTQTLASPCLTFLRVKSARVNLALIGKRRLNSVNVYCTFQTGFQVVKLKKSINH